MTLTSGVNACGRLPRHGVADKANHSSSTIGTIAGEDDHETVWECGNGSWPLAQNRAATRFSVPHVNYLPTTANSIRNGLGQVLPVTQAPDHWLSATAAGQVLTGNNGNDVFWDFTGGDALILGTGSNTINLQSTADTVTAPSGGGVNTAVIWTWGMAYTLPTNVQNLTLKNPGQTGIGNLRNIIIIGGTGNDTIDGGGGSDALIAGTGADVFVIRVSYSGSDSITGFKLAFDRVELAGFTKFHSFADVTAALTQIGSDAVLFLGSGNNLVFRNQATSGLSASNFQLPENLAGLHQTFGAEFELFTSSPDGSSGVWRTSLAHGGRTLAASSGETEYYNDASTGANPFSLVAGVLGIAARQQPGPGGRGYA